MNQREIVFHIAIPSSDLDAAYDFYVDGLGCRIARRYDDRITVDFFGAQLVCHLAPEMTAPEPAMYPRHFGATLRHRSKFDDVLNRAKEKGLEFFSDAFVRFEGLREEHDSFFLCDPSNNLVEFKYYRDPDMIY